GSSQGLGASLRSLRRSRYRSRDRVSPRSTLGRKPEGARCDAAEYGRVGKGLKPTKGDLRVLLATDYPFLNILWTMIIFFAWVIFIWVAITVLIDVFRTHH